MTDELIGRSASYVAPGVAAYFSGGNSMACRSDSGNRAIEFSNSKRFVGSVPNPSSNNNGGGERILPSDISLDSASRRALT